MYRIIYISYVNLFDSSSEIFCGSVLVKYFVRVFQLSAFCEWSSEVLSASVLEKCFVGVF
jgi:hypothetical protein